MWGTDMTATVTVGEGAITARRAHAAKRGTRFEALDPVRPLRHDWSPAGCVFGTTTCRTIWQTFTGGGVLRHRELAEFRAGPEGNGVAERFIRTLKENLLWVRSFDTIEELRLALLEFKRTYNEQWMLEKYHYQSPAQVRPSSGWTRQHRCEYRQTTVQEPWGATTGVFQNSYCQAPGDEL